MSLARKNAKDAAAYRQGYLKSEAWRKRRSKFYIWIRSMGKVPMCQVCKSTKDLQLHHLSYGGVYFNKQKNEWVSGEPNTDLLPLCPAHHEALHRYFDTHTRDLIGANRRWATLRWVNNRRMEILENRRKKKL